MRFIAEKVFFEVQTVDRRRLYLLGVDAPIAYGRRFQVPEFQEARVGWKYLIREI